MECVNHQSKHKKNTGHSNTEMCNILGHVSYRGNNRYTLVHAYRGCPVSFGCLSTYILRHSQGRSDVAFTMSMVKFAGISLALLEVNKKLVQRSASKVERVGLTFYVNIKPDPLWRPQTVLYGASLTADDFARWINNLYLYLGFVERIQWNSHQ